MQNNCFGSVMGTLSLAMQSMYCCRARDLHFDPAKDSVVSLVRPKTTV